MRSFVTSKKRNVVSFNLGHPVGLFTQTNNILIVIFAIY